MKIYIVEDSRTLMFTMLKMIMITILLSIGLLVANAQDQNLSAQEPLIMEQFIVAENQTSLINPPLLESNNTSDEFLDTDLGDGIRKETNTLLKPPLLKPGKDQFRYNSIQTILEPNTLKFSNLGYDGSFTFLTIRLGK